MKKIISILLVLIAISLPVYAAMRSVAIDGAKLRKGPGPDYEEIFDYSKYTPLRLIEKGSYYSKVQDWQGMTGWIENDTLSMNPTAVVRKIKVNLRSGPGTGYRMVTKLLKGSVLEIEKKYYNWYKVRVVDPPTDEEGWVYNTLVWGY
ncbi:MAG: SH3 domain-containing protein [bacterium]